MFLVGMLVGLTMQFVALHLFDASSPEGFIAYLIGFVIGTLIYNDSKGKR